MLEGFVWHDAENGPAFHLCGTLNGITFLYGDDSSIVANFFLHPTQGWKGEFTLDGNSINGPIPAYSLKKYADLSSLLEQIQSRNNPDFLFLDFSILNGLEQSLSVQRVLDCLPFSRFLIHAPKITPCALGVAIGNEWSPRKQNDSIEGKEWLTQAFDDLIGDLAWDKEPAEGSLSGGSDPIWQKTPSNPGTQPVEVNRLPSEGSKVAKTNAKQENVKPKKSFKRSLRFNGSEIGKDFKKNWVNHAFFFLFEALSFCVLALCKCSQNITPLFFGLSIGLNGLFAILCALPVSFIAEDNGNDQLTPSLKFGFACSFVFAIVGIVLSVVFSLSSEERRAISYFAIPYGASPLICYLACYFQWRKADKKKEDKQ